MVDNNKVFELKKHVNAIHSSSAMGLMHRKIANVLLYNAYDNLLTKEAHSISVQKLCELTGYCSNDYKTLKSALKALICTVVEWNIISEKKEDDIWVASSMITEVSIAHSVCSYSYSPRMRQLFYRPDIYGRIDIKTLAKFKSSYGLTLYENCIRYQNLKSTPWLKLEIFRKLMGVGDTVYSIFRDFKRRVLDKAIEEVNQHTVLSLTPEFRRQGRRVESIRFIISNVNDISTSKVIACQSSENNSEYDLLRKLKEDYGLSDKHIIETMSLYDREYILEKISIIETSQSFLKGEIKNLAKYLHKALVDDFQPVKSSKAVPIAKKYKQSSAIVDKSKGDYSKLIMTEVIIAYQQIGEEKQEAINDEFKEYLDGGLYSEAYKKNGLSNPLVADQFSIFVRSKPRDWYTPSVSYADFCKQALEESA